MKHRSNFVGRAGSRNLVQRLVQLGLALLVLAAGPAFAFDAERTVRMLLDTSTGFQGGRVEVEVGTIPNADRLAPCARPEPYLPPGARLWGRSVVGIRCREGAVWEVLVPVHVKVFGPALVAARALTPRSPVQDEDVREEEVELTREAAGLVRDRAELAGKVASRPVQAGMVLRREHLVLPVVVSQGDPVKVLYQGRGFVVSTAGKALQSGASGQAVRVQLDSGRVMSGVAREGRVVEVSL